MTSVVGISLGSPREDFEFTTRFLGKTLTVRRFGTDGSAAKAAKLLRHWERHADAIGLGAPKDNDRRGSWRVADANGTRLMDIVKRVPVTTGDRLDDILQEWAVRHTQIDLGNYFNNAKVLFFSGRTRHKLDLSMSEYTGNMYFSDTLLQLCVPNLMTSIYALSLYI